MSGSCRCENGKENWEPTAQRHIGIDCCSHDCSSESEWIVSGHKGQPAAATYVPGLLGGLTGRARTQWASSFRVCLADAAFSSVQRRCATRPCRGGRETPRAVVALLCAATGARPGCHAHEERARSCSLSSFGSGSGPTEPAVSNDSYYMSIVAKRSGSVHYGLPNPSSDRRSRHRHLECALLERFPSNSTH